MHLSKMVMAELNHFCIFIILFSCLAKLILAMFLIHFKNRKSKELSLKFNLIYWQSISNPKKEDGRRIDTPPKKKKSFMG